MSPGPAGYGRFYGVGVGPGDPELITVRAARVLGRVDVVFSACAHGDGESLARRIAEPYLAPSARVVPLHFPMTRNRREVEAAWDENARRVLGVLEAPADAAFITLGDPSTFSTFTYLWRRLSALAPGLEAEVVPGITSYQAAAAQAGEPLAEGEESLVIVSGAKGGAQVERFRALADNLVVLKVYRRAEEVARALREGSELEGVVVSRCGLPGERVHRGLDALTAGSDSYYTLVIAKNRRRREWPLA
ncbi:precorrin-2 C(20)-methyltransferase [Dissulfurirhabdus thermomarina]|uniref:Precorrin-2 C(20)-methyltransferase n=1 Tax=Dissulfurirhabdus thermomarina TaxID=1765737 RepID=A0A6N9TWJ3_DISTH|nr:precorrin-2 C(20)-methyltransferase [Dissulfurirhabdus thermomarina]NDY42856.1 precorrin-2 C(20)-methyltransferase [Dissulfurirhabdus thermomarina]NMX23501.1 precorrin-2 C(20)-methyltransferase [Dissulfurirhabdus thermomarina]